MVRHRLLVYSLIAFIWTGLVYYRISYHLGGTILIGIGYVFLGAVLIAGRFRVDAERRQLFAAIKFLVLFLIVYIFLSELFFRSGLKDFFSIDITLDTFHMIQSAPIWFSFLLLLGMEKKWSGYCKFTILLLLFDVIATIVALYAIPTFAKNLAAGIVTDEMLPYKIRGAMGYELTYSVAILTPLFFVFGVKKKNILFLALGVVSIFYVYLCSFLLGLLALVFNLAFSGLYLIKSKKVRCAIVAIIAFVAIFLLWERSILGNLFMDLSEKMDSVELERRLSQIGRFLLYNDDSGDSLARFSAYENDLSGIIKSPVFGSMIVDPDFVTGGHSTILGIWSAFGLVGLVPFLAVLWHIYQYSIREIASVRLRGVIRTSYLTFILIAIFNPVFANPHIFLCVVWLIPAISKSISSAET